MKSKNMEKKEAAAKWLIPIVFFSINCIEPCILYMYIRSVLYTLSMLFSRCDGRGDLDNPRKLIELRELQTGIPVTKPIMEAYFNPNSKK